MHVALFQWSDHIVVTNGHFWKQQHRIIIIMNVFFLLKGYLIVFGAGLKPVKMASATEIQWLKGRVKAVTSGDCLVLTALVHNRPGAPPEKTITLSSLMAPKMVSLLFILNHYYFLF